MKIYLVGGAVRDLLLNKPCNDRDYVVVGSTVEEMLSLGFKQVGADFPVFLHPETGEEYALARTERKTGTGHKGFETFFSPDVTLEEDLSRRDLTINAIAKDLETGEIIDPFNGRADLHFKTLRATSHAFTEDPLRILRLYRFKAQLGEGWTIDFFTERMARSNADQLEHISPERKWKEMEKALKTNMFHDYMRNIAELWLVPELSALKQVQQPKEHHPEGNAYIHTLMCLKIADDFDFNPVTKFAVLCHDFGKAVTWEKSNNLLGHEADGVPVVEKFCENLRVPNEYRDTALAVTEHHTRVHCLVGRDGNKNAKPRSIMKLLEESGCLRNEARLYSLVDACLADAWGRGQEHREDYPQRLMLVKAWKAVKMLDTKPISADLKEKGKSGLQIGEAIRVARIQAIRESLK